MKVQIVVAGIASFLTGCAALTAPARVHELNAEKNYWFDYDASRRGTIFSKGHSCAEPAPDVALTLASKAEAAVDYQGLDANTKVALAINAVKLAERSQMVLFFREALFRLCEITRNSSIKQDDIKSLYIEIIRTALRLGARETLEIDKQEAIAKIMQAELKIKEAEVKKAELEKQQQQADAIEKTKLQEEIKRLNEQIAKSAVEKATAGQKLENLAEIKKAETAADLAGAAAAKASAAATIQKVKKEDNPAK